MKSIMKAVLLIVALGMIMSSFGCSKVPAGHVGVKVYLLGGAKGVDHEELSVGRYWIGYNEELYLFPTYTQNYVWTKDVNEGSENNESITFQTKKGLDVNTDVGIAYHIDPTKVSTVFQKYRKGIEEITDIFLRNSVRDAFVSVASKNEVEYVYGEGKSELLKKVQAMVMEQVGPIGIVVEKIYLVGSMRLPPAVVSSLNSKIQATQTAMQRENEVREAKAEAAKKIATAEGEAQSILKVAKAQSKANKILAASITPELVRYKSVEKWNGSYPQVVGGEAMIPMVNLGNSSK